MVLDRQCAVEAGKEFPNLVVGEERHVNNCRILWPSERTSFPIQTCEQRGVVLRHIHTLNHTAYCIQFGGWFSGPCSAKTPVFGIVQELSYGARLHNHILGQVLLPSSRNTVGQQKVFYTSGFWSLPCDMIPVVSVCLSWVSVCLCVSVCLSLSVCVDNAKTSNRRAVATWSLPRPGSSNRSHRRRHGAIATAAAAGDVIDDDDDMDDDSITYLSLPADIKPPEWFLTTVSFLFYYMFDKTSRHGTHTLSLNSLIHSKAVYSHRVLTMSCLTIRFRNRNCSIMWKREMKSGNYEVPEDLKGGQRNGSIDNSLVN